MSGLLVSVSWLKDHLGRPGVKAVDASWYLPSQSRDAKAEFLAGHIPGAVFFDIDAIADHSTDLPHMLPDEHAFAAAAGALGLSETDTIVVYDGLGLFSAPRVWWTLTIFGVREVRVLDGGLPAWTGAGYPLESGELKPAPARFTPHFDRQRVVDIAEVRAALQSGTAAVVDARSAARFRAEAPEPRPGLRSGHMPGSHSLPFDRLVQQGRLIAPAAIRQAFEEAGVDLARPAITTCGSGVTAALLAFALESAGKQDVAVYDGAWAEWASRPDPAIVTGPE
jgi:thiosulfate/3-mercaptopyruvate sulfurtransferase